MMSCDNNPTATSDDDNRCNNDWLINPPNNINVTELDSINKFNTETIMVKDLFYYKFSIPIDKTVLNVYVYDYNKKLWSLYFNTFLTDELFEWRDMNDDYNTTWVSVNYIVIFSPIDPNDNIYIEYE